MIATSSEEYLDVSIIVVTGSDKENVIHIKL